MSALISTTTLPSDETVPRLGLGTWRMGANRREEKREIAALTLGMDQIGRASCRERVLS